ncbi:MAG: HD-GYP domain-containing protein [Butyrivibrio sp.]
MTEAVYSQEETERFNDILLTDMNDNINHGICVSNLTYLTARQLGIDDGVCNELAVAGLLHDIGKLRLSRYLYGRAHDSFALENIKYMRMHSRISYDMLKKYDFSEFVLETVLHHHENYDGTGYPDNLKGDDIPFGARVMRVADTFTALISDRPYRKAFDYDTAMRSMIDEISNYDMEVFLAFQKIIHEPETMNVIKGCRAFIGIDFSSIILGNEDTK